jgi:hypothetical protein
MFTYHMRTAPWQLIAIYYIVLGLLTYRKQLVKDPMVSRTQVVAMRAGRGMVTATESTLMAAVQSCGATADTIHGFMEAVGKRHGPSLSAYYMATTLFSLMVAVALVLAGLPSVWCATFPLAVALAALLLLQQRSTVLVSVGLPGSRCMIAVQTAMAMAWCGGGLPTAVLVAPIPAVAVYLAAAHAVACKLRTQNIGLFLLSILVIAGSVPASFINFEAAVAVPIAAPNVVPVTAAATQAAEMSCAYYASPATMVSASTTTASSSSASMACAALTYKTSGVPSKMLPDCGVTLPPALREYIAKEGDSCEWMHDSGAGNKHITPYITDIAEWTSSEVTTLGGVGTQALIQYGTGKVHMVALDANNQPYCYTLHDVRYVPSARVRLLASDPERRRGIHLRTDLPGAEPNGQLRPDADGMVHIPFTIRHSHWWTKGVVLHADRHPVLPPSSSVGVSTNP